MKIILNENDIKEIITSFLVSKELDFDRKSVSFVIDQSSVTVTISTDTEPIKLTDKDALYKRDFFQGLVDSIKES